MCKHTAHSLLPNFFYEYMILVELNMFNNVEGIPILWNLRHIKVIRESYLMKFNGKWRLINDWRLIISDGGILLREFSHLFL